MSLIEKRMARIWTARALAAATVLGGPGTSFAQSLATPSRLEACIRQRADTEDFSGVVSVVEHSQSLAMVARGERGGLHSAPITPDTRFNIASASKMFTAVAVGQLIDAGRLKLDDPVGKYVAGLTPEADRVTIRQLLTHTSGLGNYFKPENFQAIQNARSARDMLPLIAQEKPEFTPGDHFEYSNSGFALLGIVVERVSGQNYGQYLLHQVFAPAGMKNSGVEPEPMASLALGMTRMTPILMEPHGERMPQPFSGGPLHPAPGVTLYGTAAGGVFSTAVDMQNFMAALLANRLTKPEITVALTTLKVTPRGNPPGNGYGYGFGIRQDHGRQWVGHNGGTLGANAEIFADRSSGLAVAVIANRDPPSATEMFSYIKELLADPAKAENCSGPTVGALSGSPHMMIMEGSAATPDAVVGDVTAVPMIFVSGLPTLEVKINGKGPFKLALDTGAPGGPHLAPRLAAVLGLEPSGEMTESDPSGRNLTRVMTYRLGTVEFGSVIAKGWMSSADKQRPMIDGALDGVVGLDAFAGYVATIDFPNGRFSLRRGALPAANGKSVFSYQGQMVPTVPLTVEGRTITAHLDTGNTVAAVIVPRDFASGLRRQAETKASGSAHTMNSAVQMFGFPIDGVVRVGQVRLLSSSVAYPSIVPVANIGPLALAETVLEIDPAHQRVRLRSIK